uniref:Uncharacterized protein n=1 Tax=Arundo donax TaxID=35708 RepID=A0A0A9HNV3_ARUDO
MNVAHGTLCSSAIAGSQWWQKSLMIQFGFLPPATASARNAANGAARPSTAFLMSSFFSGFTSAVDSAPSGRPSTIGAGSGTRRMRGDRCAGTGGSLATFLGVERKVTAWPLDARRLASSRYGIMCPNASHGNSTTSSFVAAAAAASSIVVTLLTCNVTKVLDPIIMGCNFVRLELKCYSCNWRGSGSCSSIAVCRMPSRASRGRLF